MTDREAAEKALKDAGFELVEGEESEWYSRRSPFGTITGGYYMDQVSLVESGYRASVRLYVSIESLPSLFSPSLTDEERSALSVCADAVELLASPGVQMALRHASKHQETVDLDADDYFNVSEAHGEWDPAYAVTLRDLLKRLGGTT